MKSVAVTSRLDTPPFPPQLDYLWQFYCQHTLGLTVSGMAPAVVTWDGLRAWCAVMDVKLDPDEALVIVRLGYEAANAQSEKIGGEVINGSDGQD